MTPSQHAQNIRELEFKLYKAEHGLGMPYSREDVAHYRRLIAEAIRDAADDAAEDFAENCAAREHTRYDCEDRS